MRKAKHFGLIILLICLLVVSGCRANITDIEIAQIDEIAREIIHSNSEKLKGKNYEITGEVILVSSDNYSIHLGTDTKFNDVLNYIFAVELNDDSEQYYDKIKKGSTVTLKADFYAHQGDSFIILMENGLVIEIDGEKLEESETVSSEIQSSDNEEVSKEEQSKLLEESRLKEESRLLEQSKAEQSRLLEESRLQEESRLLEESKLQEQSRLLEQSRLREESRLREQSKAQQMQEFTFILNTDSKVYHLYECSAAKRMKSDKKRYVTKTAATKSEAMRQIEADGYHVCGICTR